MRCLDSSETPVLHRGRTVPVGYRGREGGKFPFVTRQ